MCPLALVLVLSLWSSAGRAADEEPEDLIRQGVQLRKRGEDAKAHGYFRRAYDIAHTPRTSAQLGLSDLSVDNWLDAEVHLTEALSFADPWIASNTTTLESSRATARTHLGKIEIEGAAPEAAIEATGRPSTKLPADGAIWVSPGSIHLRLEATGFQPATQDVKVSLGSTAHVRVSMARIEPDVAAAGAGTGGTAAGGVRSANATGTGPEGEVTATENAGPTPEDRAHRRRTMRIVSMAAGGVGVATAVAGLIIWRTGTSKGDALESDGMARRPYNPSNGNYHTLEQTGVGLLVGGGAIVAASAIGYLLNRERPATAETGETGVSVGIGPGEIGALIAGRF